jgi:molybdenum cofactor cytidylyltransferase
MSLGTHLSAKLGFASIIEMTSSLIAILAAGESRRMGAPKLCLPWKDTTILGHLLSQWREAGAENILVIHPPDPQAPVVAELDRLNVPASQRTPTLAFERGMMGSVVTAAGRATQDPTLTHLVIALGDQPHLRPETLRDFLQLCAASTGKIVRILHDGKPGHPIALPASLCPDLSKTSCATLRDFLGQPNRPVVDLTSPDSGVLLDIDTPDDYAHAKRL